VSLAPTVDICEFAFRISNLEFAYTRVMRQFKKNKNNKNMNNMNNILSNELKEEFYIRVYFNTKEGFEIAGIKRAYLDFNRTLVIKDKNQENRNKLRNTAEQFLKNHLLRLISLDIDNQEMFDSNHENVCVKLTEEWNELSIGQAQKWINMTLKYWLLFGEKRIPNIEKNAIYFHIPIDSFVQKDMFGITEPKPWSKIRNYAEYMKYQQEHREKNIKTPPIIYEFEFFNKTTQIKRS